MKLLTSYASQAVNLLVGLAFLPLLIAMLSTDQFVLWSLFTAIAGLFLQLEATVQATVSRNIAGHSHGTRGHFEAARCGGIRVYRRFALFALIALSIGGNLYLSEVDIAARLGSWQAQWLVFVLVYFANYLVGHNNAVVIATDRIGSFGVNNMVSRVSNLVFAAALLALGFGIWGLVGSFAASVMIGCLLNAAAAQRSRAAVAAKLPEGRPEGEVLGVRLRDIGAYAIFLALSYGVYRAILLGSAALMSVDTAELAALALGLQLFTFMVALALTPVTVRVAPLMKAISADAREDAAEEFARIHLLVNLAMVSCCASFIAFVALFDHSAWPQIPLPSIYLALALSASFLVEVNLQTMAGLFVGRTDFWFVPRYAASVGMAFGAAAIGAWAFRLKAEGMVLTMAVAQLTIALPFFVGRLQTWPGVCLRSYRVVIKAEIRRLRHFLS